MQNETLRVHGQKARARVPYKYEGAHDGYALVGWLRLNESTPDGRKVAELLDDFQRLRNIWPKISLASGKLARGRHRHVQNPDELRDLPRKIDSEIKALFSPPEFLGFTFEDGRSRTFYRRFPRAPFLRAALIAEPFFTLGTLGLLHRIRQCPMCGLWIFAKCERETCCSDACRQDLYRTTERGKRKRTESQERYRKRLKQKQEAEDRYRERKNRARMPQDAHEGVW